MGWCSGTDVFDIICDAMLASKNTNVDPNTGLIMSNTKEALKKIITELEEMDWDCQQESEFWDSTIVQEAFKDLHPDWFEESEKSDKL